MTPICTEHAALLRALARNTNDKGAQRAYSDWLQERGNPGWLIVVSYPITQWFVKICITEPDSEEYPYYGYQLPWLAGWADYRSIGNPRSRIKYILEAYANGKVHES